MNLSNQKSRAPLILSCFVVTIFLAFLLTQANAGVKEFFFGKEQDIQTLLQSELGLINMTENQLRSIPSIPEETRKEIENELKLLQAGRKWNARSFEEAAKIYNEIANNPSVLESIGKTFVSETIKGSGELFIVSDIAIAVPIIGSIWDKDKREIVDFYIIQRSAGKNEDMAWQETIDYVINYKLTLTSNPLSDFLLKETNWSEYEEWVNNGFEPVQSDFRSKIDPEKEKALHAAAEFIWDGISLQNDLQFKESLKQRVLSEIEKAQKTLDTQEIKKVEQSGFLSHIASFITNGVQIITNSLKTTYTSVKEFFTGATSQKDEVVIQPSDLSGQISNALPGDANKANTAPVQQSSQPKPTPPASSSGGSGSIPQTQQEMGLIKSEFFRNDKTAEQIITSESSSVDIRTFTDDINLIQKGISNSPELFEYKVISALRMLGMSRPDLTSSGYFIGEMLLNKFQKLHGLEISPFVTANVLRKIDTELAFREQKDKELVQRFPLYSRFTESLLNQPTKEHVAALYTLAFESLPPHLVRWDAQYFESFLRAQARDLIVNLGSDEWKICTADWFMYGVVSRPCPTKISIQEGQVVGFWDEMKLIDMLLHEYAHFLDKSVGYSHALTIDTAGFNSISFFKHNPEGYTTKNPEEYYRRKQPRVYATEFVTQYAVNSPHEDFAESFVMYVSQGKVFRELANRNQYLREKYDWLKKNVFNGVEYNTGDIRGISIWQRSIEVNKNYFESQPLGSIISMPSHPATYSLVIPEYIFEYAFPGL